MALPTYHPRDGGSLWCHKTVGYWILRGTVSRHQQCGRSLLSDSRIGLICMRTRWLYHYLWTEWIDVRTECTYLRIECVYSWTRRITVSPSAESSCPLVDLSTQQPVYGYPFSSSSGCNNFSAVWLLFALLPPPPLGLQNKSQCEWNRINCNSYLYYKGIIFGSGGSK